jgi:hypothetical protein
MVNISLNLKSFFKLHYLLNRANFKDYSIFQSLHCKKELAIFPSPAGMSLTKLSLAGKKLNYSRPGRV